MNILNVKLEMTFIFMLKKEDGILRDKLTPISDEMAGVVHM